MSTVRTTTMDDHNPKKKQRLDATTDYTKCIICQKVTCETLVKNTTDELHSNMLYHLTSRAKCGERELFEPCRRLEHTTGTELQSNGATYHSSCRKGVVNFQKLQRAQERMTKAISSQNISALSRAPGRPSDQIKHADNEPPLLQKPRLSRNTTANYDKQLCFFCQTDQKENSHAIQTANRGKQLHDYVEHCSSDIFKVYLSTAIKPDDALSIDIRYHTTCWTKHVVHESTSSTCTKEQYLNEANVT